MIYTISNEIMDVAIESLGAELWSIKDKEGTEYLWQGNPEYWKDRAVTIFPYVGRLPEKKYTLKGQEYPMSIHGFAAASEFQVVEQVSDKIVFLLKDSEATREEYPYGFSFYITFALKENSLVTEYKVVNENDEVMYFGIGGHPGFNVPLESGFAFEDYVLEFSSVKAANRIEFNAACFVTGNEPEFEMEEGKKISLQHDMFDEDAIVLRNMDKTLTLKVKDELQNGKKSKSVEVTYPDMDFVGIWHRPKTDAPYVCIEPWASLPAGADGITHLEKQDNLIALDAKQEYNNVWTITIH